MNVLVTCKEDLIENEVRIYRTAFSPLQVNGGFVRLAGNEDSHKNLDKFDFGLDRTINFGVTRP